MRELEGARSLPPGGSLPRALSVPATLFLAVALAVCASASPQDGAARPDPNVLTARQMDRLGTVSLLQAVQALRPHWLNVRGRDSFVDTAQVMVFRDGVKLGDPSTLAAIQAQTVALLRYYDPLAATGRWGICCGHGVIYVSTLPDTTAP